MKNWAGRVHPISILCLLCMIACVEPYTPPESIAALESFLVVDGFLNASSSSVSIKLSRAVNVAATKSSPPEQQATVSIEAQDGTTFSLPETSAGTYEAAGLPVNGTTTYRLKIRTSNGTSYTSDYVELKEAALLDSIVWRGEPTGVKIYANSHDPSHKTTYYRYSFTETWEYRVTYVSDWMKAADGYTPIFRNPVKDQVYTCWQSAPSQEVLTYSTKRLSDDIVSMYQINFIKKGSRLLSRVYSIDVVQRAVSESEYQYWDLIRKTTETVGGLFDPLPSQVIGNVHNDNDPTERVLGYFSGGYVQEQRIFIFNRDLPGGLTITDPYPFDCELKFVPIDQPEKVDGNVFVATVGIPPTGYSSASPNCADCTTLGGTTNKPTYWPQ